MDVQNPRLPAVPQSQRDAVVEMAEGQGQRFLVLCRHIAQNGLNPSQRFMVIPDDPEGEMLNVLDGNRRLAALRVLENPELLAGKVSETTLRRLKDDAATYTPVVEVPCAVFRSGEEADLWILLMHQGELEGAGIVSWGNQQKARHRERMGSKEPHLQVLDFVTTECKEELSPAVVKKIDSGKYPLSTLERVIQTAEVRKMLGIEVAGREVVTRHPKAEVLKGLKKVVDEIGSGAVKVGDLMNVDDRVRYVKSFAKEDLPSRAAIGEKAAALTEAPEKVKPKSATSKDRPPGDARQKLIPASFTIQIPKSRINDIYHELKRKLNVDNVPNATGVLFRVFLEMSLDDYIDRCGITRPSRDSLGKKLGDVAAYMEREGLISKKALTPVKAAIHAETVGTGTILNAVVHNQDMTITGTELKSIWTRFEPFVEVLWAELPSGS
jgi:hypothetical protein